MLERLETAKLLREQGAASLEVALNAVTRGAERVSAQVLAQVGALTQMEEKNDVLHEQIEALTPARSPGRWWQFWRKQ